MYSTGSARDSITLSGPINNQQSKIPTSTSHEKASKKVDEQIPYLDLFSTSAELQPVSCHTPTCAPSLFCINGAPFFAYQKHDKTYAVTQGCCNSWNCPRCGIQRAKSEYGRIITGIRKLAENPNEGEPQRPIFFITITCKGREINVKDAEANYLIWTHKFLDSCRAKAKRSGLEWSYVAVTERQKRGHPHSHMLTSWVPPDQYARTVDKYTKDAQGILHKERLPCLGSHYLERALFSAGLGSAYDITVARTIEGTARYVAKYLFKDNIFTTKWPPGWKRVRYSNNFPKWERPKSEAFVLLKRADWQHLTHVALAVVVDNDVCKVECEHWLRGSDMIIIDKQEKQ